MILKRQLNIKKALPYIQYELALASSITVIVYLAYQIFELQEIALPAFIPGVLGAALAIFIGFRNNAAYARWGEGAQLWAGISNYSRIFARLVITFVESHNHTEVYNAEAAKAYKQEMVYRHLAWVNAVRLQLRNHESSDWDELQAYLSPEDWHKLQQVDHKANYLLMMQGHRIYDGMRNATLQGFDSFQIEGCLAQFSNYLAQSERIKNIPIPRQYTFFTRVFVWIFLILLPLSTIQAFSLSPAPILFIPVMLLITFVFSIAERTGAANEEPFENRLTDVPLSYYCREIERDLKTLLDQTNLPNKVQPQDGYLY